MNRLLFLGLSRRFSGTRTSTHQRLMSSFQANDGLLRSGRWQYQTKTVPAYENIGIFSSEVTGKVLDEQIQQMAARNWEVQQIIPIQNGAVNYGGWTDQLLILFRKARK